MQDSKNSFALDQYVDRRPVPKRVRSGLSVDGSLTLEQAVDRQPVSRSLTPSLDGSKSVSFGSIEESGKPWSGRQSNEDAFEDEASDPSHESAEPLDPKNNPKMFAKRETRQILTLRVIVLMVLALATALVSFAISYNTRQGEEKQFASQFTDHAVKLMDAFRVDLTHTISAMDNLAVMYTSQALASQSTWPYTSLPEFEIQGASSSSLAKTELLAFLPMVTDRTRLNWESFSRQSSSWLQNAVQQQSSSSSSNIFSTSSRSSEGGRLLNRDAAENRLRQVQESVLNKQQPYNNTQQPISADVLTPTTLVATPFPASAASPAIKLSVPTRAPTVHTQYPFTPPDNPVMPVHANTTVASASAAPASSPPTSLSKSPSTNGTPKPIMNWTAFLSDNPASNPASAPAYSPVFTPTVDSVPLPVAGAPVQYSNGVSTSIYYLDPTSNKSVVQPFGEGPYFPIWQSIPVIPRLINYNLKRDPDFGVEIKETMDTLQVVIGKVVAAPNSADLLSPVISADAKLVDRGEPWSKLFLPVFDSFGTGHQLVGMLNGVVFWGDYFRGHLPYSHTGDIICVLDNTCGQQWSYRVNGRNATYLGQGDYHDHKYDYLEQYINMSTLLLEVDGSPFKTFSGIAVNSNYCPFTLRVYPTYDFEYNYLTWRPLIYTIAVVISFVVTSATFITYDYLVERRQKLVMEKAVQSSAVVSSLFPAVVRDRLFPDGAKGGATAASAKRRLKTFLDEGKEKDKKAVGSKPIADLFPYTTVMFADISGFTAWSSVREPAQVFVLLETIYSCFDKLVSCQQRVCRMRIFLLISFLMIYFSLSTQAKKRAVFKVETIGDCYVAVTGLPGASVLPPVFF